MPGLGAVVAPGPGLPDPWAVPNLSLSDPGQLLAFLVLAVLGVVLMGFLFRELRFRSRRYGGGDLAALVMLGGVLVILVAITPELLPLEFGLTGLMLGLFLIYRPEQAVRLTGGPSLPWRALRAGRELQVLVAEAGGPSAARGDEEIANRIAALDALEGPETSAYLELVRATVLADRSEPGVSASAAALAQEDARLRALLGIRPAFERELERRAEAAANGS